MSLASLEYAPELEKYKLSNVRSNGRTLGTGAYGVVIELDMQGARCAGKQIHGVLMEQPGHVTEKFASECRLMSGLRHPHIVQFLGLWFQRRVTPEGSVETIPVLVMEYLPTDLDGVLGRYPNLPIDLKISILHDIAKGLAYLHLRDNPIIHRDLSARNVLLDSAMVAKIADFGVARRIVAEIQGNRVQTMTAFPGTVVYMPPEVNERYNEKIDIFSFGVLILYAIIQQLPSDILAPTYTDESGQLKPRTEIERRVQYVEQAYEILADEQKPECKLLKLMEQCLQTDYQQRPNVELLLTELEDLARQVGSVRNILQLMEALRMREEGSPADVQEVIDSQKAEIEYRDARIAQLEDACISQSRELEQRQAQVERLEEELQGGADSVRLQLEEQLRETQTELDSKQRELEVVTVQMQRQEQDLISQLEAKEQESRGLWEDIQRKDAKLEVQQGEIQRYMDAVQLLDRRFRGKETELETVRQRVQALQDMVDTLRKDLLKKKEQIEAMGRGPEVNPPTTPVLPNPSPQSWTPSQPSGLRVTLPISWLPCAPLPFGMNRPHATGTGNRQNSKVIIGGGVGADDDGKRVAFYDEKTDRWTEFGRYPLKLFAIALLNDQLLLVGGYDKIRDEYSGNICKWNRRFWERVYTPMPTPRSEATAIGYQHWLVVAGGVNRSRSVLTTVEVLDSTASQWSTVEPLPYGCSGMQSAVYLHPSSPNLSTWYLLGSMEELRHRKASFCVSLSSLVESSEGAGVWKTLPDPPFSCSGVVVVRGYLLAVGGKDRQSQRKSEVYIYLPGTCEWLHVASLPVARHSCSCAFLSEGKFLVLGGKEATERSRNVLLGSVTFSAA